MRISISLAVLLGVSTAFAVQSSPHKKAAQYSPRKKQAVLAGAGPRAKKTTSYLTNSTAGTSCVMSGVL